MPRLASPFVELAGLAALALSACASHPPAPLPSSGHIMSWVAPLTNTDGSAITLPLTFGIYVGPCGREARIATVPLVTYALPANASGCGYVTAIEDGEESDPTPERIIP